MRRIYSISVVIAALLCSTPLWSTDKPSGNNLHPNGVVLKQQCLMTVEGEYPSKCNWVFVGEPVHVQSFQPKLPLNPLAGKAAELVLVRTGNSLTRRCPFSQRSNSPGKQRDPNSVLVRPKEVRDIHRRCMGKLRIQTEWTIRV